MYAYIDDDDIWAINERPTKGINSYKRPMSQTKKATRP